MQKFNPGDIAPRSGRYSIVDGNGSHLDSVEVQKGNRLPPTQSSEYYYVLED